MKSSSQADQAWQDDEREDFFILFGAHGLPSLFTLFIDVVSNSPLRRGRARCGPPGPPCTYARRHAHTHRGESCSRHDSYLFLWHSGFVVAAPPASPLARCPLSEVSQWTALFGGNGRRRRRRRGVKGKKKVIGIVLKSRTRHKQGSSDTVMSKGLDYFWWGESKRSVDMFY